MTLLSEANDPYTSVRKPFPHKTGESSQQERNFLMVPMNTPEPKQPMSLPGNASEMREYGNISLVLGIASWITSVYFLIPQIILSLVIFFAGSLITIVFGHLGLRKDQKPRWAAVTGLILGYLQLIVFIYWMFLALTLQGG